MKAMKYILLLNMICMSAIACNPYLEPDNEVLLSERGGYMHFLAISFCDKNGNDQVSPLGEERYKRNKYNGEWSGDINPDKYDLTIVLSKPTSSSTDSCHSTKPGYDNPKPFFRMSKIDDIYYLINEINLLRYRYVDANHDALVENPRQEYITYKIICPTIFGDEASHELVAYWDGDAAGGWIEMHCIKALFDDKECDILGLQPNGFNYINIVLDK
ncbi:MAG: hypothetical protein J5508_01085 [Bacteroidales bacterium]|nr:hypothetical protein [Bacteroidales bacterium]